MRDGSSLPVTGKSCYRVECEAASDCCTDFVPDASCAALEADCNANPNDCLPFRTLCACNRACEGNLCGDTSPECLVDNHCFAPDAPFCVGERCVECLSPADCPDAGDQCVDHACVAACTVDEECALLSTCVAGLCEQTGCTTDLECVFVLGTTHATCRSGACRVACASNLDCRTDLFEVCQAGQCVFAGCNTDAECRAYLDIEYAPTGVQAACR